MPGSFTAKYSMHAKGMKLGEMQRRYETLPDGRFRFISESRTTGIFAFFRDDHIVEESIWQYGEQGLQPVSYRYDHTGSKKERHVSVEFDHDKGEIRNTLADNSWVMPMEDNTLDKLIYQLVIMSDLKAGKSELVYNIADGGRMKEYRMEILGEETRSTPLGDLHSIKLQRHKPNSKRSTTLWCAPQLHYLPIRVEYREKDGDLTTAELISVEGL